MAQIIEGGMSEEEQKATDAAEAARLHMNELKFSDGQGMADWTATQSDNHDPYVLTFVYNEQALQDMTNALVSRGFVKDKSDLEVTELPPCSWRDTCWGIVIPVAGILQP